MIVIVHRNILRIIKTPKSQPSRRSCTLKISQAQTKADQVRTCGNHDLNRDFIFVSSSFHLHFIFISSSCHLHVIFMSSSFHFHFIFISSSFHLHVIFLVSSLSLHRTLCFAPKSFASMLPSMRKNFSPNTLSTQPWQQTELEFTSVFSHTIHIIHD